MTVSKWGWSSVVSCGEGHLTYDAWNTRNDLIMIIKLGKLRNDLCTYYLKQEGQQSYACHVMLCFCQRVVWLLDVDYVQLLRKKNLALQSTGNPIYVL